METVAATRVAAEKEAAAAAAALAAKAAAIEALGQWRQFTKCWHFIVHGASVVDAPGLADLAGC